MDDVDYLNQDYSNTKNNNQMHVHEIKTIIKGMFTSFGRIDYICKGILCEYK